MRWYLKQLLRRWYSVCVCFAFMSMCIHMKWCETVSCSIVSDSLQLQGVWPSVHRILQGRILDTLLRKLHYKGMKNTFSSPRNIPDPGIELRSLALRADSFPSEPTGNPIYIYRHLYIASNWQFAFMKLLLAEFLFLYKKNRVLEKLSGCLCTFLALIISRSISCVPYSLLLVND